MSGIKATTTEDGYDPFFDDDAVLDTGKGFKGFKMGFQKSAEKPFVNIKFKEKGQIVTLSIKQKKNAQIDEDVSLDSFGGLPKHAFASDEVKNTLDNLEHTVNIVEKFCQLPDGIKVDSDSNNSSSNNNNNNANNTPKEVDISSLLAPTAISKSYSSDKDSCSPIPSNYLTDEITSDENNDKDGFAFRFPQTIVSDKSLFSSMTYLYEEEKKNLKNKLIAQLLAEGEKQIEASEQATTITTTTTTATATKKPALDTSNNNNNDESQQGRLSTKVLKAVFNESDELKKTLAMVEHEFHVAIREATLNKENEAEMRRQAQAKEMDSLLASVKPENINTRSPSNNKNNSNKGSPNPKAHQTKRSLLQKHMKELAELEEFWNQEIANLKLTQKRDFQHFIIGLYQDEILAKDDPTKKAKAAGSVISTAAAAAAATGAAVGAATPKGKKDASEADDGSKKSGNLITSLFSWNKGSSTSTPEKVTKKQKQEQENFGQFNPCKYFEISLLEKPKTANNNNNSGGHDGEAGETLTRKDSKSSLKPKPKPLLLEQATANLNLGVVGIGSDAQANAQPRPAPAVNHTLTLCVSCAENMHDSLCLYNDPAAAATNATSTTKQRLTGKDKELALRHVLERRIACMNRLLSNKLCALLVCCFVETKNGQQRLKLDTQTYRELHRVCDISTEFHFEDFSTQMAKIQSEFDNMVKNGRKIETGDYFITRHSNLSMTHVVFHLLISEEQQQQQLANLQKQQLLAQQRKRGWTPEMAKSLPPVTMRVTEDELVRRGLIKIFERCGTLGIESLSLHINFHTDERKIRALDHMIAEFEDIISCYHQTYLRSRNLEIVTNNNNNNTDTREIIPVSETAAAAAAAAAGEEAANTRRIVVVGGASTGTGTGTGTTTVSARAVNFTPLKCLNVFFPPRMQSEVLAPATLSPDSDGDGPIAPSPIDEAVKRVFVQTSSILVYA